MKFWDGFIFATFEVFGNSSPGRGELCFVNSSKKTDCRNKCGDPFLLKRFIGQATVLSVSLCIIMNPACTRGAFYQLRHAISISDGLSTPGMAESSSISPDTSTDSELMSMEITTLALPPIGGFWEMVSMFAP